MTVVYSRDFLDVQVRFAQRVRVITGVPLEDALLSYTNLYVRFGHLHFRSVYANDPSPYGVE